MPVHHTARRQAEVAAREAAAARAALEDGRTRHSAAALREHLHAGDDCPVCLQAVARVAEAEGRRRSWPRSNAPIAQPTTG